MGYGLGWVLGVRPITHMGWVLGPDLELMMGFAEVYPRVEWE
jgi:hypothetical protein